MHLRRTKIIATMGPGLTDENVLKGILREGVDIMRINASHTTPEKLEQWINYIRKTSASINKLTGILVDLQGPRVRTGKLQGGKAVQLKSGQTLTIIVGNKEGNSDTIYTSIKEFTEMLQAGDPILIDNGNLKLDVLEVGKSTVKCKVINGGMLGENKGINLPNAPVTLPALTPKDLKDLAVAARMNVDFIALSFVRSEDDVMVLKKWLTRRKKQIAIIAKIEKPGAVSHIWPIMNCADGIMVARGDLGIELGVEKLPAMQKELIEHTNVVSIPVITATQMLESMIENPIPTRAEASDIANAVFDGTDAVMLSGETAIGKYPVECVRMMSKIIREAEQHTKKVSVEFEGSPVAMASPVRAITHAAYNAANDIKARAIVVFTRSGKTARLISKLRPLCPVIVFVPKKEDMGPLTLLRGVIPVAMPFSRSTDKMVRDADRLVIGRHLLKRGDSAVMISGKLAIPAARYLTKIYKVGED